MQLKWFFLIRKTLALKNIRIVNKTHKHDYYDNQAGDAGVDRLGFYTGEVAEALVDELWLSGGILSYKDFENYRAQWTEPIKVRFF